MRCRTVGAVSFSLIAMAMGFAPISLTRTKCNNHMKKCNKNTPNFSRKYGSVISIMASKSEVNEDFSVAVQSHLPRGLSQQEATDRLDKFGKNILSLPRQKRWFELFLEQFDDKLVQTLLAVATISSASAAMESVKSKEAILQSFLEPFVIFMILIINAGVGVWQQISAINSLESLKKLQPTLATVLRQDDEGNENWIMDYDASRLVPGDIIRLCAGDCVPADACITSLLSSSVFKVDESLLTGESIPVQKIPCREIQGDCEINKMKAQVEQNGMVFSGTLVTKGMHYHLFV